ncbi:pentatricopeptide repeat-containing protein At1g04840-like [Asparagus officinalis]|nr:pentatricopeptide repeat-containing protein At1g04840-like [Asparagus officinalis]
MPDRKVSTWNCLIDGYVKRGDVESAVRVFEEMTGRDVVSWTTVVVGFLHNGDAKRALDMFGRMMEGGVRPNSYTLCSALAACAKIGAVEAGIRIHDYVSRSGFRVNGAIGTALVDMYSKCGKIENAGRVFDEMKDRDVLAYTAMINGWGIHGRWQEALRCFEDMKCSIAEPDDGAFLAALVACQHSGKVELGLKIFDSMRHEYKTEPTVKHYTSVLNLLGRAGRFNEALDLLNSMPIEPDFVLWGALFNACQAHNNVELAELATKKLLKLKPIHSGGYVFLSNVYAGSGRWEDAERVRIDMKSCCVEKSPGWSCIEIGGKSHQFVAGDQSHPQSREIYEKLEEMVSQARASGYKPSTEWVLHNIEEEDKEDSLGWHSEKLALALGLLSTVEGEEITIVKNLRVCGDCHSLMKLVSKLYRRVIILRDIKRFHQFKDRECSCGDYW